MITSSASKSARFVLTITTPDGSTDDRSATIQGMLVDQIGTPVLGRPVEIDEAGTALGTATVGADGLWSIHVLLQDLGANTLTAKTAGDGYDPVTSSPVVLNLQTVLSPPSNSSSTDQVKQRVVPTRDATLSGQGGALTFVFRPHPGHAVVDGFGLSGAEADRLALPSAVFTGVADVLHHTTMAGGDAVIHFSPSDSVTLVGVSKAALRVDHGALLFHG